MRHVALTFLAALIVVASATGSVNGSALNRTTFDDALGEDPAAPDIATVRVSNDDEGTLTFRVALPNRPTLTQETRFNVYIDADDNVETGLGIISAGDRFAGVDYRLLYDLRLHGDPELWLLSCHDSVCGWNGTKVPLGYAGGPTFEIDRSELGDTRRFRFILSVADGYRLGPGDTLVRLHECPRRLRAGCPRRCLDLQREAGAEQAARPALLDDTGGAGRGKDVRREAEGEARRRWGVRHDRQGGLQRHRQPCSTAGPA